MPLYIYQHPETQEYIEIIQGMNEEHKYFEDGVEWKRIFTVPNAAIDSKIDAFSQSEFIHKTGNKKGTVGDILDLSSELSEKRAQLDGKEDPVKRKYFEDYKKRNKKDHLQDKPKTIETSNYKIDL